jgi:alkylated DNA repair dioxygenase AlkB
VRAPVTYKPGMFVNTANSLLDSLWNDLAWVRHDKVPRREYYVAKGGQDYSYGKAEFARTYKSQPLHPAIEFIWQTLEVFYTPYSTFDVCFLNGYEDGRDQLGWHADNSPEMDDARPIAIVTLGAERDIWFREANEARLALPSGFRAAWGDEALRLEHGSLCLMAPGMQDTHQHRIPKAGFVCGPRISLTFRGYVDPNA